MSYRLVLALTIRAAQMLLLMLLISAATFGLSALIPGDYFTIHQTDPTIRAETLDQLRQRYGLDQPFYVQYGHWLARAIRMDLGQSLFYGAPVHQVVSGAAVKTLWLALPALFIGMLGGISIGTLHGVRRGMWLGHLLDSLTAMALSLPSIVLGLLALLLAARTGWFPVGGAASATEPAPGALAWIIDRAHHLVLPVVCLAIPIFAAVERIHSAAVQSIRKEAFLLSARARGLEPWRIYTHHLLLPSLNPVLSVSGPIIGGVLSGSLVLEVIFSWPGLGQVTYEALYNRDPFLLLGCVLGSGALLILGNQIADLLLRLLDPRAGVSMRQKAP